MEEKEKNQKTVVAFIAGLLIGGLLVWVFSVAPDKKDKGLTKTDDATEQTDGTTQNDEEVAEGDSAATKTDGAKPTIKQETVVSKDGGSITVDDQAAGAVVNLGAVTMPVASGWIVVHEVNADGSLANALGASRYTEADGLKPTKVDLLRATKAGQTYRVVIHNENGDRIYDKKDDLVVTTAAGTPVEDSFTAK